MQNKAIMGCRCTADGCVCANVQTVTLVFKCHCCFKTPKREDPSMCFAKCFFQRLYEAFFFCTNLMRSPSFLLGWESQLLETGFLAIFLCPLWTLSQVAKDTPPSFIVIWAYRWLIFRIMLGAVSASWQELFYWRHENDVRRGERDGYILFTK